MKAKQLTHPCISRRVITLLAVAAGAVILTTALPAQDAAEAAGTAEAAASGTEQNSGDADDGGPPESSGTSETTAAEEAVRSTLEEWRDTLLYGINSEIEELLPTLTENREEDLIPEVVQLFETSRDSGVLAAAARYLATVETPDGHDRARQLIVEETVRTDDVLVALNNYLRETGADLDEETAAVLERMVLDGTPAPARSAVRLLAAAGHPSDALIDLYRDNDAGDEIRGAILLELGERGDPEVFDFVTEIIREGEEAETQLQRFAIDTLGKLGDERGLPTILRQLDSDNALTRAYAVSALSQFETDEAEQALLGALRDEFWRVRVAALETIAERRLTEATPAVIYKARRDPEEPVRLQAIETLAALDEPDGWSLLEERFLSDRTPITERGAIAEALMTERLRASRDTVLEVIEAEWDREDSRVLDMIGRVASRVEDQAVAPIAERLLNHPNYIIQIYGIRAVGRSRLAGLVPLVEDRRGEGNHRAVRQAAIRSLEQLGPR